MKIVLSTGKTLELTDVELKELFGSVGYPIPYTYPTIGLPQYVPTPYITCGVTTALPSTFTVGETHDKSK
jgi:hypothetical protein